MNIAEIQQRLSKYPDVRSETDGATISVLPGSEAGFMVALTDHGGRYTVAYNGWHEEFTEAEEALDCFAFGLSEACRLQEWRRGGAAYKWTVQYRQDDEWIDDSTTGLIFSAFWKPAQIVYLQNHLIPAACSAVR
jgi:hypothetical protein